MKKLFGRADILVIISVLALSLLLFIPNLLNNDDLTAQIYVDGELIEEICLKSVEDDYTFSPKNGTEIAVKKGQICFNGACCRDELCIRSGWLSKKGQTSACLPERVVITIKGTDRTDMMTY
ncbi:MAG: NusG domain II-containing protein [Clostridia bacterium]|nr:NusG domain II-containing protein [Clostridia bacterium]